MLDQIQKKLENNLNNEVLVLGKKSINVPDISTQFKEALVTCPPKN